MLVVMANTVGPKRPLLDILAAAHADRVLAYETDRASREKRGAPATEDIDWTIEEQRVSALVEVVAAKDAATARDGYEAGFLSVSVAPQHPGPWEPPAGLEGVEVRIIFPAGGVTRDLRRAMSAAVEANDIEALLAAQDAIIRAGVKDVYGLTIADADGEHRNQVVREFSDDELEAFRACHLLPWLLSAVLYSWGLPRGKAWRSGGPPLPT
jgi:hypothetical protein